MVLRMSKAPIFGVLICMLLVSLAALLYLLTVLTPTNLVLVPLGFSKHPDSGVSLFRLLSDHFGMPLLCGWGLLNGYLDLILFAQLLD